MSPQAGWLRAVGLTKRYGGQTALDAVTLEVRAGEVRGLVGANGAGKSTLVKALAGELAPEGGEIRVDGTPIRLRSPLDARMAGIVDVPQQLTVAPNMSIAENVMLGHYRRRRGRLDQGEMRLAAQRVLEPLGVVAPLDTPVGSLPPIEQRLVMVARALAREARLVLLDEPTANASAVEVDRILAAIRALSGRGVSVVYVSHRLDEVVELCDTVTALRNGRVVADMAVEAGTRESLVRLVSGPGGGEARRALPSGDRSKGRTVLEVDGVSAGPLRDVSLAVRSGEIVGVAGLTGSGASELVLTVCGALPFAAGSITICGLRLRPGDMAGAVGAGVGLVAGNRELGILPNHRVAANVSLSVLRDCTRYGVVRRRDELRAAREVLDLVGFSGDAAAPLSTLSGGNQQKALLARPIAANARLLAFDDPTAGVDIEARRAIHEQLAKLAESGTATLLVSTDLDEIAALADRIIILERGAVKGELSQPLTEDRVLDALGAREVPTAGDGSPALDEKGARRSGSTAVLSAENA